VTSAAHAFLRAHFDAHVDVAQASESDRGLLNCVHGADGRDATTWLIRTRSVDSLPQAFSRRRRGSWRPTRLNDSRRCRRCCAGGACAASSERHSATYCFLEPKQCRRCSPAPVESVDLLVGVPDIESGRSPASCGN